MCSQPTGKSAGCSTIFASCAAEAGDTDGDAAAVFDDDGKLPDAVEVVVLEDELLRRRAVHAAEHGDPDAVRDADDDLMCVGYEDLIKRLAEEAEDYMH